MLPEFLHAVKAIFFDLDNTLIERDQALKAILPSWLATHAPQLPVSEHDRHITRIMAQDNSGFTDRNAFVSWIKATYAMDNHSDNAILSDLATRIALQINRNDETIIALKCVRKRYLIGVISNGSARTQRLKLSRSGLLEVFDEDKIYLEEEVGLSKPDPSMFVRALDDHKVSADQALFVGDHPANDIMGASCAGLKTCWIQHSQDRADLIVEPDLTVTTIDNLLRDLVYEHE